MNNQQTAVTFSVSEEVKRDIDRISKQEQRSKSAVFRDMYKAYTFSRAIDEIQSATRTTAIKLGLETDDEVIDYIKGRGKFKKTNGPKT